MNLDEIDRRILAELQADGRLSNQDLAHRVSLTPSPCVRRVRMLEKSGYIQGYRAVLNRDRVGLGLTVFVEIKVASHGEEGISSALQAALSELIEVVSFHIVSGEADFLLEVVVPDLRAYEHFLMERLLKFPSIKEVRSNFAIRSRKTHAPLPLNHLTLETKI